MKRVLSLVGVGAVGLVACTAAIAAESNVGASLGLRLAHSDNVSLAGEGAEQTEDIAVVTAGINFSRQQPRANSSVVYNVQGIFYDKAADADEVYHNLNASTRLELAPERFFMDLFGLYDQTVADPADKYSFNNLALTGNRIDVAVLGASPSVALTIGSNVIGELRYTHTKANYDDPGLQDSLSRTAHFGLSNANARQGGTWGVDYVGERLEYKPATEFEFEVFTLNLGYWVNGAVRLFTIQGLEGDYSTFQIVSSSVGQRLDAGLDEHFWYVGMDWRPDDRTSFQVQTGERSYGRAQRLLWNRQLRFGGVSASYSEEPSSFLREQLRSVRRTGEFTPLDELDGPRGALVYLLERADVGLYYDRPRSDVGIRLFAENRFDLARASAGDAGQPPEEYTGAELSLGWQVNPRSSVNASFQLAERHSDLNAIDDELEYFTLGWTRSVGRQSQLSLGVSKQRSVARSGASQNYEENQFVVGFQRAFGLSGASDFARRYSNVTAAR
jgi:hypothetical protein